MDLFWELDDSDTGDLGKNSLKTAVLEVLGDDLVTTLVKTEIGIVKNV